MQTNDWSNFKKLHNEVNNSIKKVKKSYNYNTFETYNGNSHKTWETINEVTWRKSDKAAINELELNEARLTNSTKITEGFSKFFAEIGPELSREIEVGTSFNEFVNQASCCFSFRRVTQLHVLSQLNKLCKRKATGFHAKRMCIFNLWVPRCDIQSIDRHWYFPRMNGRVQKSRLFLRKLEAGVILLIIHRYWISRLWPRFSRDYLWSVISLSKRK